MGVPPTSDNNSITRLRKTGSGTRYAKYCGFVEGVTRSHFLINNFNGQGQGEIEIKQLKSEKLSVEFFTQLQMTLMNQSKSEFISLARSK